MDKGLVERLRTDAEYCLSRVGATVRQIGRDCSEAVAYIERLEAQLAAFQDEMPTIMYDPGGKDYPCQERPMTPAEAKRALAKAFEELTAAEAQLAQARRDALDAYERAAKVVEHRVAIGMKSSGVVNNALLQALPDAIRALGEKQ